MFTSRMARAVWVLFLADAVLLTVILTATSPSGETIVGPLRAYLRGVQALDSWRPMKTATKYLEAPHEKPVYTAMLVERGVKFQYPPSSLLFTRLFDYDALNVISWCTPLVMALAVWLTLQRAARGTPWAFDRDDVMAALGVFGLTLAFYPIIKAYSLGQIQAWINTCFAVAVLAFVSGREDVAGLAVGLACLMKPTYLTLGLWAVLRARWRFAAALGGIVVIGTSAALIAYGIPDNLNYGSALSLLSHRGEAFAPNQSVNGFLQRLLGNADSLKFQRSEFPPFHPVVYGGTLASFAALFGLALWVPRRSAAAGSAIDLGICALSVTMTSPIAWEHHYGIVLPILAAVTPVILTRQALGAWTAPALFVGYVLVSQSLLFTNHWAGTAFGVFQSYMLFGAAILLCVSYATLFRSRPSGLVPEEDISPRRL
jgi:alpha-1,2-mannosyltransferase